MRTAGVRRIVAEKRTTGDIDETHCIHTPGGMHHPSAMGDAADGADIAATDMSVDAGGSRADPSPPSDRPPVGRLLDELDRLATSDSPAPALREELATIARRLREELAAADTGRPFDQGD
jgi:hypothetical protein